MASSAVDEDLRQYGERAAKQKSWRHYFWDAWDKSEEVSRSITWSLGYDWLTDLVQ